MTLELAAPRPGVDLVPDGWCESTVMPWADVQVNTTEVADGVAVVSGLIAAYSVLNQDTLELAKARRYLEIRWGELLGPAPGHGPGRGKVANKQPLSKFDTIRFRKLADNRDVVVERIRAATDADQLSRNALLSTAHVSHNSGENEWYTPGEIIDAAATVMDGIDLDPASTAEANQCVAATVFFTEADDGLAHPWAGKVWMNPPYSQPLIGRFCQKLVDEYGDKNVAQACVLVNNATETSWFQTLAEAASAICFPRGRVKFWHPTRPSATPLQGQAVIYFGPSHDLFRAEFSLFGFVGVL